MTPNDALQVHPEYLRGYDAGRWEAQEIIRNRESAIGAVRADYAGFKRLMHSIPGLSFDEHGGLVALGHAIKALVEDQRRQIEALKDSAPTVASLQLDIVLTNGRRLGWQEPPPVTPETKGAQDQ